MTKEEFSKHFVSLVSRIVEKSDKYELTLISDGVRGVTADLRVYHPQLECFNKTARYYLSSANDPIVQEKNKQTEATLLARLDGAPLEYNPSIHGEWKEGMEL